MHKYEKNYHDLDEKKKQIVSLNTQLEEEKMTEKVVRSQLKEKEEICEMLEYEVVSLGKELGNSNAQLHRILNRTETLNKILNY